MNGSSANASPQVNKLSSPEMSKKPATAEPRQGQTRAPPQFLCTDQSCEFNSIGFPTEDARHKHINEEHIKPAEDPLKFAEDSLAEALNLDPSGNAKKIPTAGGNMQSPGDTSKQAQTNSMKRQGSTAGSKPTDLIKTIAGKAGTPKPDSGLKYVDNTTPVAAASGGTVAGEATGTTIDPQDLFFGVGGLEMGGGGAISNMSVYRAITPNDTPESSKDSLLSEPNSDLSEGVAINVTLDMGFDIWDPFTRGQYIDPDVTNLGYGDIDNLPSGAYPSFTWDEVQPDFGKAFSLDTTMYSLDTS
jgi:hypothetical protein